MRPKDIFKLLICFTAAFCSQSVSAGQNNAPPQYSDVKFRIWIHRAVALGSVPWRRLSDVPKPVAASLAASLMPGKDVYVGVSLRGGPRLQRLVNHNPDILDWYRRITAKPEPTVHKIGIQHQDYFPRTFIIRAGDTIVDPEFHIMRGADRANGMRIEGLLHNQAFSSLLPNFQFAVAESRPVAIKNGNYPDRIAYAFITNHSCAALSDVQGKVRINSVPCGVKFTFQVQFPWRQREEFQLTSPSLTFDRTGRFEFTLDPSTAGVPEHIIRIVPVKSD